MTAKPIKQTAARCTAYATYNAITALVGQISISPVELWIECKSFFNRGAIIRVSEKTGTELWRILFIARHEFPDLVMPTKKEEIKSELTADELDDIEEGKAVAIIGSNLHALAVIDARKSWLGYWQIRVHDSNGKRPKWFGLWRYRLAPMEVAVIRRAQHLR